jgi:hypothetical protein
MEPIVQKMSTLTPPDDPGVLTNNSMQPGQFRYTEYGDAKMNWNAT